MFSVLIRVVAVVLDIPEMVWVVPGVMTLPSLSNHLISKWVEADKLAERLTLQTRVYWAPAMTEPSSKGETVTA